MTTPAIDPVIAQIGERLREARLNAHMTVREAASNVGLHGHGTLVQYENGHVLPPLDRLALLAKIYRVPLASLVVSNDALMPVITLLEHANSTQIDMLTHLLKHVAADESSIA